MTDHSGGVKLSIYKTDLAPQHKAVSTCGRRVVNRADEKNKQNIVPELEYFPLIWWCRSSDFLVYNMSWRPGKSARRETSLGWWSRGRWCYRAQGGLCAVREPNLRPYTARACLMIYEPQWCTMLSSMGCRDGMKHVLKIPKLNICSVLRYCSFKHSKHRPE